MSSRIATIVILAEDLRQANFARRWLIRRGHHQRSIRINICTGGSGEQYVRDHYPGELVEERRRAAGHRSALVVIIDADIQSVANRYQQLDAIGKRRLEESVAIFVPRRNIETWLLYLCGEAVVEEENYKRHSMPTRTEQRSAEQFEAGINTPPANWLPSLQTATTEARRIPKATS